jgi:hypothetical protein
MSLRELLASIRTGRRSIQQGTAEEGAQIGRRLRELLAPPEPMHFEPLSTSARNENDLCSNDQQDWTSELVSSQPDGS